MKRFYSVLIVLSQVALPQAAMGRVQVGKHVMTGSCITMEPSGKDSLAITQVCLAQIKGSDQDLIVAEMTSGISIVFELRGRVGPLKDMDVLKNTAINIHQHYLAPIGAMKIVNGVALHEVVPDVILPRKITIKRKLNELLWVQIEAQSPAGEHLIQRAIR